MSSILYDLCTRVPLLKNLFVSSIFPNVCEKLGQSAADVERHTVDEKLREVALEFAASKSKHSEMAFELDWQPDYSNCNKE